MVFKMVMRSEEIVDEATVKHVPHALILYKMVMRHELTVEDHVIDVRIKLILLM